MQLLLEMQALTIEAANSPIKFSRVGKLFSSQPSARMSKLDSPNMTQSFSVPSKAARHFPDLQSDTNEIAAASFKPTTRRGHSSQSTKHRQTARKLSSPSNLPSRLHGEKQWIEGNSSPTISSSIPQPKYKNVKLTVRFPSFPPSSPSKRKTFKHSIHKPFTPHEPEVSMTIHPVSFTISLAKERDKGRSVSPSKKTVEVKIPSTQL